MRLVQFISEQGRRRVGRVAENGAALEVLNNTASIYSLVLEAGRLDTRLETLVQSRLGGQTVDYRQVIAGRRLLPPLDHPDPAHCYVTGTGLTHLGSAQARDAMHHKIAKQDDTPPT